MTRPDEIREKALKDLQRYEVLMLNGHFDFGNVYHGAAYLNLSRRRLSVVPGRHAHHCVLVVRIDWWSTSYNEPPRAISRPRQRSGRSCVGTTFQ